MNKQQLAIEIARQKFEEDAAQYGFDLNRFKCAAPELWSEYKDDDTGYRWSGWLAAYNMLAVIIAEALPHVQAAADEENMLDGRIGPRKMLPADELVQRMKSVLG